MTKNKNNKSDNENLETQTLSENGEISDENINSNDSSSEEKTLKNELEAAIDDKKRALAEAENTRRRSIKDLEQSRKYGHLSFSREMLSVVDSLESAVNSIPKNKEELSEELKNFILGVEMTLEQLKQVFNNHNITRINPEGEAFDYNVHQAMFEKETNDFDPGTIVEVMQPGWTLHERLLRPAMVGVAKKKTEKE
jgi:molecular chaperone GrpE